MWCLRRWALDELALIDETHIGQGDFLMFPIRESKEDYLAVVIKHILDQVGPEEDKWTTVTVADLITKLCVRERYPIKTLMKAIEHLYNAYSDYIVLVPSARGFATIAAHRLQEPMVLRGYYQDRRGRHISHLRFHSSIGELSRDRL